MAISKKTSRAAFPQPEALLFDNVQSRTFRDDPFARILLAASIFERRAEVEAEGSVFPALPFWAPAGMHRAFTQLGRAAVFRQRGFALTDSRDIEQDKRLFVQHIEPVQEAFLEVAAIAGNVERLEVASGLLSGSYDQALEAMMRVFPKSIANLHARDISAEELGECLGRGRSYLAGHHGVPLAALDEMSRDSTLCEALSRLVYFGASDPAALSVAIFSRKKKNAHCGWGMVFVEESRWLSKEDLIDKKSDGSLAMGVLAMAARCFLYNIQEQSAKMEEAQRAAFFCLQGGADGIKAFREAIVLGTGSAEGGLKSLAWEPIGPLGDFDLCLGSEELYANPACVQHVRSQMERDAVAAPGRGIRFAGLQAALLDAGAIIQWRNPLSTLRSIDASQGIGVAALEMASADAGRFKEHAARACCQALLECAKSPSLRKEAASILAGAVARGFADLSGPKAAVEMFERLRASASPEDAKMVERQRWFADVLSRDPMGGVALAVEKVYGLEADEPAWLVGEAKKALMAGGMPAAAWRRLAASPALRDLLTEAAAGASLAQAGGRKNKSKAPRVEAARVMASADQDGQSASAKISAACAKKAEIYPLESCLAALDFGSRLRLPEPEMALMVKIAAASPGLRALLCGALPALPAFEANGAGLGQASETADMILEDAKALPALSFGFFKAMSAKARRALPRASEAEAQRIVLDDFSDILDCAKAMPPGFWSRLEQRDPLSHALRIHQEWVAELARESVDKDPQSMRPWTSLVGEDRMGRASAVELLNGRELFEEGQRMGHCVASYSKACHAGSSRIISLRLDGARCSTLELAPHNAQGERLASLNFSELAQRQAVASWRAVQHRGKSNAAIAHPEIVAFARAIEERSTKAFASFTKKMESERLDARREKNDGGQRGAVAKPRRK